MPGMSVSPRTYGHQDAVPNRNSMPINWEKRMEMVMISW